MKPKVKKRMAIAAAVLVCVFLLLGVAFNLVFRTISYSFYKSAVPRPVAGDSIRRLEVGDDGLVGYAASGDYTQKRPLVLYFGGSGEIAQNAVQDHAATFPAQVFACVDYPGTQESAGSMNLASMQRAAVALYDFATQLPYVDATSVSIVGYSYGTGIATYLAQERACTHLALLAPYRDVKDLYNAIIPVFHSPFGWFVTDNINTAEYAAGVAVPVLVVTSDADTQVKPEIATALSACFAQARLEVAHGVAHEAYWQDEGIVQLVQDFLNGDNLPHL